MCRLPPSCAKIPAHSTQVCHQFSFSVHSSKATGSATSERFDHSCQLRMFREHRVSFLPLAWFIWCALDFQGLLAAAQTLDDSVTQCLWTDCLSDNPQICPGGTRNGQPCNTQCPTGYTTTWTKAGNGTCDPGSTRFFCCPENAAPTCTVSTSIRNILDAFECTGKCDLNQVKIGTDTTRCPLGSNDVCCTRSTSLVAQESCCKSF